MFLHRNKHRAYCLSNLAKKYLLFKINYYKFLWKQLCEPQICHILLVDLKKNLSFYVVLFKHYWAYVRLKISLFSPNLCVYIKHLYLNVLFFVFSQLLERLSFPFPLFLFFTPSEIWLWNKKNSIVEKSLLDLFYGNRFKI